MIKKAMLTDFAGYCAFCKKPIKSNSDRGGYVEYYELNRRICCKECSIKR